MKDQKELASRIGQIVIQAQRGSEIDIRSRFLEDDEEITFLVNQAKGLGLTVVLTQGTFDLIHIGHARYVQKAKSHGHLLIVGVEDDVKARSRKGENRPVVPFGERREMLCHLRYVDAVAIKRHDHKRWHLINLIKPDVLIGVEGTYTEEEKSELAKICARVVILPRQAETSTSAKVRTLVLDGADTLKRLLVEGLPRFVDDIYQSLKKEGGS